MKRMRNRLQKAIVALIVGWLTLFVLLPNLMIFVTSFLTRDDAHFVSMVFTLNNYGRLLDPLYADVLLHSLNMACIATLCCLLLGYPFALVPDQTAGASASADAVSADCAVLDQLSDPDLWSENFSQHARLSQ
ncbi:hypothetical protein E05_36480 [Plautia stali symbiont]|nr:hypothetical protein E05_36480 [Plautia stali symbiont]